MDDIPAKRPRPLKPLDGGVAAGFVSSTGTSFLSEVYSSKFSFNE